MITENGDMVKSCRRIGSAGVGVYLNEFGDKIPHENRGRPNRYCLFEQYILSGLKIAGKIRKMRGYF